MVFARLMPTALPTRRCFAKQRRTENVTVLITTTTKGAVDNTVSRTEVTVDAIVASMTVDVAASIGPDAIVRIMDVETTVGMIDIVIDPGAQTVDVRPNPAVAAPVPLDRPEVTVTGTVVGRVRAPHTVPAKKRQGHIIHLHRKEGKRKTLRRIPRRKRISS
jgi:hypothetical protein